MPLLIYSAEIDLAGQASFSEVGGDCPLTPLTPGALAPNATCSYSFQFHPLTSGGRSATFTVHTGAGDR